MPRPFHVEYQPRLMVSVRDAAEAVAAVAGGADIIDILEPGRGAVGMADLATLAAIVETVGGRKPVSAALGDLGAEAEGHGPLKRAAPGLTMVTIGLAHVPRDWQTLLDTAFAPWRPARPIVVAYADAARSAAPPIDEVFAWAAEHLAGGVLIDTAIKDDKDLFHWLDQATLRDWVMHGRHRSLLVGVAGGLTGQTLKAAVQVAPDIISVRTAACDENRLGTVQRERVAHLREIIERCTEEVAWRGN